MTLVRGQGRLEQRGQVFEALINWSSNGDHKDLLGSNKPGPSEALTGSSQAPLPVLPVPDVVQYMQKDMDHLL